MEYIQKSKTVKIAATSKATVQVNNNYYSFSYTEEREIPQDDKDVNLEEERKLLWDTLNEEVDKQIDDIVNVYKK